MCKVKPHIIVLRQPQNRIEYAGAVNYLAGVTGIRNFVLNILYVLFCISFPKPSLLANNSIYVQNCF